MPRGGSWLLLQPITPTRTIKREVRACVNRIQTPVPFLKEPRMQKPEYLQVVLALRTALVLFT